MRGKGLYIELIFCPITLLNGLIEQCKFCSYFKVKGVYNLKGGGLSISQNMRKYTCMEVTS